MDNIEDIVKKVISNIEHNKEDDQQKILRIWDNILSFKEKKHTSVDSLKEGCLIVKVDSSVWLYQMNFKRRRILEALKEECKDIHNIYFKIGKV